MEITVIDTITELSHVITVDLEDTFTDMRRMISEATEKRPRCFDMYFEGEPLKAQNEDTAKFIETTGLSPGDQIDIGAAYGEVIDEVRKGKSLADMMYYATELEEVVREACKRSGAELEFAAPKLRDNEQIVEVAVKEFGCALRFASDRLRAHPATVMAAVYADHRALFYADNKARDDYNIIYHAVGRNGFSLGSSSPRLRNDPSIVSRAVAVDGLALRYGSDDIRANPEIVLQAAKNAPMAVQYGDRRVFTKSFLETLKEELGQHVYTTDILSNLPPGVCTES